MQLFFCEPDAISNGSLCIDRQEALHISRVLRFQVGDTLQVTNGQGALFSAIITKCGKSEVFAQITLHKQFNRPSFAGLTLGVGILKNRDKLEWIVEKAVELGIGKLLFMHTDRSERDHIRLDRMRLVAVSAMKQSLQTWLPEIETRKFRDVVEESVADQKTLIVAHELTAHESNRTHTFLQKLNSSAHVTALVGPEGGFTSEEVSFADATAAHVIQLGPNRLRTETAAIHLLSIIRFHQELQGPPDGITLYRDQI